MEKPPSESGCWSVEEERIWQKLAAEEADWLEEKEERRIESVLKLLKRLHVSRPDVLASAQIGKRLRRLNAKPRKSVLIENSFRKGVKEQGVPMEGVDDESRNIIRQRLEESLSNVAKEVEVDDQNPSDVAVMVETELFKTWGHYNGPNKSRYRSVMFNIKDPNNPDFRRKVMLGVFNPESICQLSTQDMASDARRSEIQKIKEKFDL